MRRGRLGLSAHIEWEARSIAHASDLIREDLSLWCISTAVTVKVYKSISDYETLQRKELMNRSSFVPSANIQTCIQQKLS